MSKSAFSLFVFSLYLFGLGIVLLLAPNFLLSLFSIPTTTEVWIRIVGVLVLYIGMYYLVAARNELKSFYIVTVYTRATLILFFAAFVLVGWGKPPLILFGGIDLLGAIWTWLALRSEAAQ